MGRVLKDACKFCGFSLVYCRCVRDLESLPCCPHCAGVESHGGA